jgi:hypothetical protein
MDFSHAGSDVDQRIGTLPIISATASFLPDSLDALVMTAGLKGIRGIPDSTPACPLGVAAAIWLAAMSSAGTLPSRRRTGVILAGGFDTSEDSDCCDEAGIATAVWYAFSKRWKWVAGVTGNGDSPVPNQDVLPNSSSGKSVFLLDRRAVDVDSMRIGGIGGILDNGDGCNGRPAAHHVRTLNAMAGAGVDVLVLHECPSGGSDRWPGSVPLRQVLESLPPALVVCGHDRWDSPLVTLENGTQVLNVAGRVVVLRRHKKVSKTPSFSCDVIL